MVFLSPNIIISSDECSFYKWIINRYFQCQITPNMGLKKVVLQGKVSLKKHGSFPYFISNILFP